MRIELNKNGSVKGLSFIGSAGVIDASAGEHTTITPFEDMLVSTTKTSIVKDGVRRVMPMSENDRIIQASELSVKELTDLYLELGITSPAGNKAYVSEEYQNTAADTDNYVNNPAGNSGMPFKVPESMVSIFKEASARYGVDYNVLVSVASAESDFNPNCTSKSGAMGIMQLMPDTAKYVGVKNAYDPQENIMGGARYLAEKLKEHGSVKLGIAAYNAGSNAVKKYNGVPPYTETQNYVRKILGFLGTDGSESGFVNNTSQPDVTEADNGDPEDVLVTVGDTVMSYSSYLKYINLLGES